MLSNFIITQQRLVVIIDELGLDDNAPRILPQLLKEQQQERVKIVDSLDVVERVSELIKETEKDTESWSVVLPPLSDLLTYNHPKRVFKVIDSLNKCPKVERILLWASRSHIMHKDASYIIAGVEYMADLIVHLESTTELTICTRNAGGSVGNRRFTYECTQSEFTVEAVKGVCSFSTSLDEEDSKKEKKQQKLKETGTFKIEIEEDELEARNALKLPYEKTEEMVAEEEEVENVESKIIYSSDDEEDSEDEVKGFI